MKRDQLDAAAALLAAALEKDAASVYRFPKESSRPRQLRWFYGWLLKQALRSGVVYSTAPDLAGVAIWLPPNARKLSLKGLVAAPISVGVRSALRTALSLNIMNRDHSRALAGKHWHLIAVGVDPAYEGEGVEATLMKHALQRADEDGSACYLETTSELGRENFERFGFVGVEGQGGLRPLPTWGMVRPPWKARPSGQRSSDS